MPSPESNPNPLNEEETRRLKNLRLRLELTSKGINDEAAVKHLMVIKAAVEKGTTGGSNDGEGSVEEPAQPQLDLPNQEGTIFQLPGFTENFTEKEWKSLTFLGDLAAKGKIGGPNEPPKNIEHVLLTEAQPRAECNTIISKEKFNEEGVSVNRLRFGRYLIENGRLDDGKPVPNK